VPKQQQDLLINDWTTGQRWDSESGAAPVSEDTTRSSKAVKTIRRYADGSFTVSAMEDPPLFAPCARHHLHWSHLATSGTKPRQSFPATTHHDHLITKSGLGTYRARDSLRSRA
jgi:hypothetical protein